MGRSLGTWRTAIVTGGASGIGLTIARRLVAAGANLGVLDLATDDDARASIVDACRSADQSVVFVDVDVTDAAAVRKAVDDVVLELGPPDLVVHSAGINIARPFHRLSDSEYSRVIDVNLLGTRHLAYAVLRHMRRESRLVLMSSMAGITPNWAYGAYSASKAGVWSLACTLRMECRPLGIGVIVVCPPNVPTPMSAAEEREMDPIHRELKAMVGEVGLERVAQLILRGAAKGRFLIVPGVKAKLIYWLSRVLPQWVQHQIANRTIDRLLKAHPEVVPRWDEAIEE